MRSPQLAQYLVSVPAISLPLPPCVPSGRNGVVSLPDDGRRGSQASPARDPLRWRRASLRCSRRRPRPRARPAGTPKILLAFDASGSMATDDGAGTPKIDAAQDAAVDLLGSLPPSTQVGLRVFGGTKPSRPIGPACRDSSLVLPIGPLDRAQAEQQIRSFKAKGRTPIAYALERAAEDLGTVGPAHDHPRLRRQGHLPAAVAVPGRPADRQGRRRDAHPGDRLQRRPVGAARAAVHRARRAAASTPTPTTPPRSRSSCACCPRARCASTSRRASPCAAARARARRPRSCPGATSTACSRTPSAGTPSSCAAGRR